MGQGVILSNLGDGKYRVKLLRDFARAEAEKNTIDEQILKLQEEITAIEAELVIINAEIIPLTANLNGLIEAEAAQPGIDKEIEKQITLAFKKLSEKVKEKLTKQQSIDIKQLIIESKKKKKTQITNAINAKQFQEIDAWCVDYSINLGVGVTVGMLEVPDETMGFTPSMNIKPGGALITGTEVNPTYIQPTISSGPSAVFFNLSLLPGVQKWKPHYRKGTITAFTGGNDCSVTLDPAYSSQHPRGYNLSVNKAIELTNVPIIYGTCNIDAFEIGDRVIVDFQGSPTTPRVIGFISNPRACPNGAITYRYEDWKIIRIDILGWHTGLFETPLFGVGNAYRIEPDPQDAPLNPKPGMYLGHSWNDCRLYVQQKYGFISPDGEQNHIWDEVYYLSSFDGDTDFDIEATYSRGSAYIEHRRFKQYPGSNEWIYDGVESRSWAGFDGAGSFTWAGTSTPNGYINSFGGSFSFACSGGAGYHNGTASGSQGLAAADIDVSGQYDLGPYLYKNPNPQWLDGWVPNASITSGNLRRSPGNSGLYGFQPNSIIQSTATRTTNEVFDETEAIFWIVWNHGVPDWTPNTTVTKGEARVATANAGGFSIGQVIISRFNRTTWPTFTNSAELINWRAEGPLKYDLASMYMDITSWSTTCT